MPRTKTLTAKEVAVIEFYTQPTSEGWNNWCKSYLLAGYSECKGWKRNACTVLAKHRIKTAIELKRDAIRQTVSVSREYCLNKLLAIADTSKDNRTVIAAITVIGDFAGYKRELAPNQEREQARQDLLSTEVEEIMVLVRSRTDRLSQAKLINNQAQSMVVMNKVARTLESKDSSKLDKQDSSILDNSDSSKITEPLQSVKSRNSLSDKTPPSERPDGLPSFNTRGSE